jgi:hypothetical protein
MRNLLKLGLAALIALVLAGCGEGDDDIAVFLSDFPQINTTGYTVVKDHKTINYYDSSSALAKTFNATVSKKDVRLGNGYYRNDNDFLYGYELNNPESKGLEYKLSYREVNIESRQGSSYIEMQLMADRNILGSEFTNLFGEIDVNKVQSVSIGTDYKGDMRSRFINYYAKIGKFFDIENDSNAACITQVNEFWHCEKRVADNGGLKASYRVTFSFHGTNSVIWVSKTVY